ncbi:MAG: ATP-grasp domain-containing protein [Ramlibacter sp.]|nr:ATP-grasp domain-containing protein [Ramlibacter sp.]
MHIVIVNRWPRFKEGSARWDNELVRYEDFFDHSRHRISYVVDALGAQGVLAPQASIARLVKVGDVNNYDELAGAVRDIVQHVGPVDQLIALSEFTLEIAARVRQALGIPGHGPAEVAVYRDKARMKEVLAEKDIRVPAFARCESVEQALRFADGASYPLILKPVDGAASIGVVRIDSREELQSQLRSVDLARYEVEEFIEGEAYHVDGFADSASAVAFQVVSQYVGSCLDFVSGSPLGSVIVQQSALRARIEAFSSRCIAALRLTTTPFHLELFVQADGSLVFLEVGARVGGSEVPHLLNKVFGVNLFKHWLQGMAGDALPMPAKTGDPSGGWLVIPKPRELPCRVDVASPMKPRFRSIWRELLPAPGDILEPGGSYDALHSGRFIFTDRSQARTRADILSVIESFEFKATPL